MRKLSTIRTVLAGSASMAVLATGAFAGEFNVPSGDLRTALNLYAKQAGVELLYPVTAVEGGRTKGAKGDLSADAALAAILKGTGFTTHRTPSGAIGIVRDVPMRQESSLQLAQASPRPMAAAGIESVLVTAQKKTEDIQMVPIAVTALSEKQLQEMKIEGGPDLLKTIPNVTFSKNNFTGYNFSIRGVGTKAISATTDPGVAVSFNNTTLIQNRLFEQEYFDVERVEVLRGPQGTLYGRNATSGVINVISAKPDLGEFFGSIKGEVGNYQSRRGVGMLNIPIITDKLAVRLAGSYTSRDGYDYNSITNNRVNGRNLWSTRLTVGFHPFEQLHGNAIWEHFNENDDRSRTGKQLCHRDDGPTTIGNTPVAYDPNDHDSSVMRRALFSQGCKPGSLYDADAFGTPNGLALPFVFGMLALQGPCGPHCGNIYSLGYEPDGSAATLLKLTDPYGGLMQSPDLRVIASYKDPKYRAKADVLELNWDYDVTPSLTFTSQTAYDKDSVYSFQDFNRFNTKPIFNDSAQWTNFGNNGPSSWFNLAPGGYFCDPQLGCSNTLAGFDISQAHSRQFSQEVRLQSNYSGPVNFSIGANYTYFNVLVDYYVMYNLITAFAETSPFYFANAWDRGIDITTCPTSGYVAQGGAVPMDDPTSYCPYIDPNSFDSINGDGHNYFRSKNPYSLKSGGLFGEVYWQMNDELKLTAGLRYTDDRKTFIPVPSQVLLSMAGPPGGTVSKGYPELPAIKQRWGKFTGRLNLSWMPKLDFTDQSMFYASFAHGYKGGGANPPTPGFAPEDYTVQQFEAIGAPADYVNGLIEQGLLPFLKLTGVDYKPTFKPEYVNAFELGTKNTLLGGSMVLNSDVFYYDYKDYQVSQIRDRTAVNENFNAKIWGAEVETLWQPLPDLRLNANFGYLNTRIADGDTSIDIMNRTLGNPNYTLVKPWVQLPSNCVVPTAVAEYYLQTNHNFVSNYWGLCGGWTVLYSPATDPATGQNYDPANYPEINGGAGLKANLGGNELPNSPHFTFNIGAEYTLHWIKDWDMHVRGDFYHQSNSWARVYNDNPYDRLRGWNNANLSLTFERVEDGLSVELYAKNVFDKTAITDAFLNSDDTALTTNVFVTDPRLIGFSITKPF